MRKYNKNPMNISLLHYIKIIKDISMIIQCKRRDPGTWYPVINTKTSWWQLTYFFFSPQKIGEDFHPFWRAHICFKWVGSTTNKKIFPPHFFGVGNQATADQYSEKVLSAKTQRVWSVSLDLGRSTSKFQGKYIHLNLGSKIWLW